MAEFGAVAGFGCPVRAGIGPVQAESQTMVWRLDRPGGICFFKLLLRVAPCERG